MPARLQPRGSYGALVVLLACSCSMDNPAFDQLGAAAGSGVENESESESEVETRAEESSASSNSSVGDGDGDEPGDGDGDPQGDGDGDEPGDGDGDPQGDGDGDEPDPPLDACPADDPSLVACYRFEQEQIQDESIYANDGEALLLGLTDGIAGMGLHCISVAAQVPDSGSLDIVDNITFAMWVHPQSYPAIGRAVWLDNSGQWGTMLDPNAGYICRMLTSNGSFQVAAEFDFIPLGEWSHIACSYDGVTTRLYANGEVVASLPTTGPILTNSSEPMALGSNSPIFNEPCSGAIDGVQIYKRALSDEEIEALAGF